MKQMPKTLQTSSSYVNPSLWNSQAYPICKEIPLISVPEECKLEFFLKDRTKNLRHSVYKDSTKPNKHEHLTQTGLLKTTNDEQKIKFKMQPKWTYLVDKPIIYDGTA